MNNYFLFIELFACTALFWVPVFFSAIFLVRKDSLPFWRVMMLFAIYVTISFLPTSYIANTVISVICILLQLILVILCYEGSLIDKVLVTAGSTAFDIVISILFISFFGTVFHASKDELMKSGTPIRFLFLIGSILFEYVLLFLFQRIRLPRKYFGIKETIIILLFIFNDTFSLFLTYLVLMSSESDRIKLICSLIAFLFLFATAGAFALLYKINEQAQKLYEKQLLELQVKEQEKQILQLHENDQLVKTIRHDMKRYLLNYRTLLDMGDYAAVRSDINEMLDHRLSGHSVTYTSNLLLNSILCHAAERCCQNEIHITSHISIPETFQDIEVMVLISNLLDNAIEHENEVPTEHRELSISIGVLNHQLSIVVKNRIFDFVLSHNPNLSSPKYDSERHGYGLKSVQRLVDTRSGLITITEENMYFIVHVLLPIF